MSSGSEDAMLGVGVIAAARFRVRTGAGDWTTSAGLPGAAMALVDAVRKARSPLPARCYLGVTETQLHVVVLRFGKVRRSIGTWFVDAIAAERLDTPWSVRLVLDGRRVDLAAEVSDDEAALVVRTLVAASQDRGSP